MPADANADACEHTDVFQCWPGQTAANMYTVADSTVILVLQDSNTDCTAMLWQLKCPCLWRLSLQ